MFMIRLLRLIFRPCRVDTITFSDGGRIEYIEDHTDRLAGAKYIPAGERSDDGN